jgi:coenzyme PQQ biosynthesis protein PqqD
MRSLVASDVPKLPRGVRLHLDRTRNAHVLLAPERAFNVDDVAVQVLQLVDGRRSVGDIVGSLSEMFNEAPSVIEADVLGMLNDLVAKRALEP